MGLLLKKCSKCGNVIYWKEIVVPADMDVIVDHVDGCAECHPQGK